MAATAATSWQQQEARAHRLTPAMAEIAVGSRVVRRGTSGPRGTVVALHRPFQDRYPLRWKPWSATVRWDRSSGYSARSGHSRLGLASLRLVAESEAR